MDREDQKQTEEAKVQDRTGLNEDESLAAEYHELSKDVMALHTELDQISARKEQIRLISDQVAGWTKRVSYKIQE